MNITLIPNRSLTLVTSDYRVLTAGKDNPNWEKILEAVRERNEGKLIGLMSMKQTVKAFGKDVAGRGEITIKGKKVFYRGVQLHGKDVQRILDYLTNKFPTESMVLFLERKLKNPSPRSRDCMYDFFENKGMPLTDRGTFLGYKGVRPDFNSVNTGSEPLIEGIRNEDGSIRNRIGDVVRMDRRYVCDDFNQPCGPGLHVGSQKYAQGWAGGGHIMVVEVDPADVVSVPTQEHEKLRVTGYRVVGEVKKEQLLDNTYNGDYVRPDNAPDPDDDEGDFGWVDEACQGKSINYRNGYEAGVADGRAHQKRKFYEVDKGRTFKRYPSTYVAGYCAGYRDGRNGFGS